MTPEQLANQIETLILEANERFGRRVITVQNKLYIELTGILKDLEVTEDGYIKQNAANRKILRDAQQKFDALLRGADYTQAVEGHLAIVPQINALNEKYFNGVSAAFKPNRQFITALQTQTLDTINTYVLNDGLAAQVKLPLQDILNQNINSGGSFAGMQKQLEAFIKGLPDADGRLLRYSKGILKDTLFNYSRTFQQSVVADLGLSWYRYVGGIIDHTRQFCSDRNGGYFHQKEIESWAAEDWAGKNPLTTESSIFTYCGGYNCVHQMIPVQEGTVPQEWLERGAGWAKAA